MYWVNLDPVVGSEIRRTRPAVVVSNDSCNRYGMRVVVLPITSNVDFGEDSKAAAAALLAHLRELAAAGVDHALVSPRRAWNEATFDAVAAILPEVHAIEPGRG